MLKRFLSGLTLAVLSAGVISVGSAAEAGLMPQTSNEHGVKVTVAPQALSPDAETWDFEVTLETHTQDLSDDLSKSALLIADSTKHMPLGWKGAPPGGHHRKGLLLFKVIAPQPRSVELQVRLSGDASPRSFKWLLK